MGYIGSGPTRFNTADELTVTGDAEFNGNLTVKGTTTTIDSASVQTVDLGDNDKIRLGDGDDLQIYSDGANAIIDHTNTGAGALYLAGDNNVIITNQAKTENKAIFTTNGAVTLYYDNAAKLATTNTGVDVTGTVTADGLTVDAASVTAVRNAGTAELKIHGNVNSSAAVPTLSFIRGTGATAFADVWTDHQLYSQGGALFLKSGESSSSRINAAFSSTGDISFYEDTGTTAKFFWDASAEALGIGTTSPSDKLSLEVGSANAGLSVYYSGTEVGSFRNDAANLTINANNASLKLATGGTERMRIDSSGNLLVGTSAQGSNGSHKVVIESASTVGTLSSHLALIGDSATTGQGPQILFSESGDGTAWAGGTIGFVRTGGNSVGDLVFGTRQSTGDINTTTTEAMRIDSSGNVGIGTSSPNVKAEVGGTDAAVSLRVNTQNAGVSASNYSEIQLSDNGTVRSYWRNLRDGSGGTQFAYNDYLAFLSDADGTPTERFRIDSSGNVGIGTSSPDAKLDIEGSTTASTIRLTDSGTSGHYHSIGHDGANGLSISADAGNVLAGTNITFDIDGAEAMRIDNGGNLLVGTTDSNVSDNSGASNGGINIGTAGVKGVISAAAGQTVAYLNRLGSDGEIVSFRKDGTTIGTIGNRDVDDIVINTAGGTGSLSVGGIEYYAWSSGAIYPWTDNASDLGSASFRFDDIYATNGTIQTSDANEKQQIAALTDAEITAAKSISQLFKTFKWNSAVTEKGDAARTHAGVIAQDVQAAMTAAGLDAGDYAFFISSTWYVDADGNEVEAEAEGAIEKNRKGIRYPELLAFVGAATEQRLANIETRLAALEAN